MPRDRREMVVIPSFVPDSVLAVDPRVPRPDSSPRRAPTCSSLAHWARTRGWTCSSTPTPGCGPEGLRIPLVLAGMASPGKTVDTDRPGVTTALEVPHSSVMAGWVHATVGVVPSLWGEPFGQVAVECLAAGTPLVVSRVGGLPDIVDDGRCGLLVEPGDPGSLAEAVRTLVEDPALAQRLSVAGQHAERFTASVVQVDVEESYRRAIESHRRRPEARVSRVTEPRPDGGRKE